MSENIRVEVPQETGEITQTGDGFNQTWKISAHIAEVAPGDLTRFLASVPGSRLAARDSQSPSKPDVAKAREGKHTSAIPDV